MKFLLIKLYIELAQEFRTILDRYYILKVRFYLLMMKQIMLQKLFYIVLLIGLN